MVVMGVSWIIYVVFGACLWSFMGFLEGKYLGHLETAKGRTYCQDYLQKQCLALALVSRWICFILLSNFLISRKILLHRELAV